MTLGGKVRRSAAAWLLLKAGQSLGVKSAAATC
jgi:hypothetical protein